MASFKIITTNFVCTKRHSGFAVNYSDNELCDFPEKSIYKNHSSKLTAHNSGNLFTYNVWASSYYSITDKNGLHYKNIFQRVSYSFSFIGTCLYNYACKIIIEVIINLITIVLGHR